MMNVTELMKREDWDDNWHLEYDSDKEMFEAYDPEYFIDYGIEDSPDPIGIGGTAEDACLDALFNKKKQNDKTSKTKA